MTNEQMRQRIAELEEGLRPFAVCAEQYSTLSETHIAYVLVRDLRTAAALIESADTSAKGGVGELLPCPFCGGPAEIVEIDGGENAGGSCVACTRCFASSNIEFERKENFVSNWNRRAALLLSEQTETPVEEAGGPLYRSAHGVAVSVIEAINAKAGRLMDDETLTDLIRDAIELELDVNALNASPEDSVLLRAEKNPAPAQETGDVERVDGTPLTVEILADALGCFWNAAIDAQYNEMLPASCMAEGIQAVANRLTEHQTLAAMRPVVDQVKLAEIRHRHDSVSDMADDEWDNRIYAIADDAHADREWLLSAIDGGNDD